MDYMEIHRLYQEGFSKSAIARKLQISRNRVIDCLNRSFEEMEVYTHTLKTRSKKLDPYHQQILEWLKMHHDLTAAQIVDWLQETLDISDIAENTVRNYVNDMRDHYHIPKQTAQRPYVSVPELPMGQQGQVDFGYDVVQDKDGRSVRLYFIAFLLSHSRFKYVEWLDRPFRTADVIRMHDHAFHYFGGMPTEMVYDQDALLAVSENAGDLILTSIFSAYQDSKGFKIYLCRKSDPETKGKVEQTVKFVKVNFSHNRTFHDIKTWNASCLSWLERTGNHKVHHNTKKRPSDMHALEKPHLQKVSTHNIMNDVTHDSITRIIQKDNVIRFEGNRYSVPRGTYHAESPNLAYIETRSGWLYIRLKPDGSILAQHALSDGKGLVISDPAHRDNQTSKRDRLVQQLSDLFHDEEAFQWLVQCLDERYPRHIVDQLRVVNQAVRQYPNYINQALSQMKHLNLTSGNDFRDIAHSLSVQAQQKQPVHGESHSAYDHYEVPERPSDIYTHLLSGGGLS
ncbi:IS21 family transposase [Alkalibacillus sp. S2W]|uniref:IS21 family transposase n=1 Tax=Alkalibacillus sp. S2W TaxID=3386553 RepID=UPI00398CCD3C